MAAQPITIPASAFLIPVNLSSSFKTFTLPVVSTNAGRTLIFKDMFGAASNSTLRLSTIGLDRIEQSNVSSVVLSNTYGAWTLTNDGFTNWYFTNVYTNNLSITGLFQPNQITGLVVWTDASTLNLADNTALTTWTNRGSQGTVNCTGTFFTNQLNGRGIVRFTTANTWAIASQPSLSAYSLFFVTRHTGTTSRRILTSATNNQLFGYYINQKRVIYIDANPNILSVAAADTAWDLFSHTRTAGSAYLLNWNGSLQSSSASSTANNLTGLCINTGNNFGETSTCEVAEIILYNSVLPTAQVQVLEGYLAWKWGLQGNLPASHPYKNNQP